MSTPQNILGKFRSYAYHHILMVCNNTEAAELLTETSEITTFQRPKGSERDDKIRYAARAIGGDENNKYITLIDGTADARFYITSATWENIMVSENTVEKDGIPQSTSMSLEGELEIVEPLGARFLNRLTDACDALSTDPIGLVFVLKTIFVGHNDDGTTEMISNIKPLLFINYDITAIFDSSGAKYKMMFVGAVNGLGKLPHTQKLFNGINFNIAQNENLQTTFNNIADLANKASADYKNRAIYDFSKTLYDASKREGQTLSAITAVDKATKFFDSNYRSVKYKITATDYGDPKYKAGDNENVRIANKRNPGAFNFGNDIGVESVIKKVMASSTGVIKDGTGIGTEGEKKYIYKIVSGLNSSNEEFVVEYHIKRYEMIMLPYEAAFNGEEYEPEEGQSILFNYIFTGKNIDIKNFDIKMEMGMAFFQIAATTDTLPDQATNIGNRESGMVSTTGSDAVASNGKTKRSKTPLFLGGKIKQPMARNTKNPIDSASFQSLLSRHAALENIEAKMIIYGNPQLLAEMQVLPSDLTKTETEKPIKDKTINPKWLSVPTLVKVNIKMPVDTNDVNTEYEDFWYTGYYSLFAVKQIFSEGEFTQELDMLSIPVSNKTQKRTEDPKNKYLDAYSKKVEKENDVKFEEQAQEILGINQQGQAKVNEKQSVANVNKRWIEGRPRILKTGQPVR